MASHPFSRESCRRHSSSLASTLRLTIPKQVVGRLIGRNGKTLQAIRDRTGATNINMAGRKSHKTCKLIIQGPTADICAAAAKDIKLLAKAYAVPGRWKPGGGKTVYSMAGNLKIRKRGCPICDKDLNHRGKHAYWTLRACMQHISSLQHIENATRVFCKCDGSCIQEGRDMLLNLLSCPNQRAAHKDMGYLVDEIIQQHHELREAVEAKYDGALEEASKMRPEMDWLVLKSRRYVGWDGTPSLCRKKIEASVEDAIDRLRLDEPPPTFQRPPLPAELPVVEKKRVELVWPFRPGLLLPLAVSKMAAEKDWLSGVDIVASGGFYFALWGVGRALNEVYLIQKVGDAFFVRNQARRGSHNTNDIGMLAESLCCPSPASIYKTSYALSKYRIGNYTVLLSSEVDGLHPESNRTVEITTSREIDRKKMMQASLNGSSHVAKFSVSDDSKHLSSLTEFCVEEYKGRNADAWMYAGQRIRHVLRLVFEDPMVRTATDVPIQMRFGSDKLPTFESAPPGSTVVPTR